MFKKIPTTKIIKHLSSLKTLQQSPRSIPFLVSISFIVAFTAFAILYMSYEPESNILDQTKLQTLAKEFDIVRTEITTHEDGTITESSKIFKERFEIQVIFEGNQIYANTPMPVRVLFVFPEDLPDEAWDDADDFHILMFPGSENVDTSDDAELIGGGIKMKKDLVDKKYYGSTELIFPVSGEYGYTILFPKDVENISYTKLPGDIIELSTYSIGLDDNVYPDSIFPVIPPQESDGEEKFWDKVFKLFFVGGVLISIFWPITKGIVGLSKRFENTKQVQVM